MNAGLPDRTTTGDLVLQQAKIVPQTQHFFDFSHGQSLLGHSVSPLARGEIPIGCPAPLSAPTQKARSRNVNINSGSNRLFHRGSDYSHPRNLYSHARNPYSHPPGIFIHIAPESVFTCPGIRKLRAARHQTSELKGFGTRTFEHGKMVGHPAEVIGQTVSMARRSCLFCCTLFAHYLAIEFRVS